jgi:hypothetical protein
MDASDPGTKGNDEIRVERQMLHPGKRGVIVIPIPVNRDLRIKSLIRQANETVRLVLF